MKQGSALIRGVTVKWLSSLLMVDAGPDDIEVAGRESITISATDLPLTDVSYALFCAQKLVWSRCRGRLICPYSDTWLDPSGLDNTGDILLQIYRGEIAKSCGPSRELASLDPALWSATGEGFKSATWMRDIATLIRDAATLTEMLPIWQVGYDRKPSKVERVASKE